MEHVKKHGKKRSKKGLAESGVSRYRAKLRAQGLRPVQIWLPDTRSPEFAAECRRQSLLVANDPREKALAAEWEPHADDFPDWKA